MSNGRTPRDALRRFVVFPLWVAIATFAILEAGLRLARPLWLDHPDVPRSDGLPTGSAWWFSRWHPVLGYSGIPGIERDFVFGTRATQNSRGERGPEVPLERRPGVPRIVVLGDSQAWGWGVADDQTIPAETARELRRRGIGDVEAVNLGSCGYGLDQSVLRWFLGGEDYAPDAVVLVYFQSNDLAEVLSSLAYGVDKPRFALRGDRLCLTNVPVPRAEGWPEGDLGSQLVRWIADHLGRGLAQAFGSTNLAAFLRTRTSPGGTRADDLRSIDEIRQVFPCVERPGESSPGAAPRPPTKLSALQSRMRAEGPGGVTAEAAPLARRLMRELASRMPASTRLVVLVVPTAERLASGGDEPEHAALLSDLAADGIEVLDPSAALAPLFEAGGAFLDGNRDPHLSPRGIAVVSAVLAGALAPDLAVAPGATIPSPRKTPG